MEGKEKRVEEKEVEKREKGKSGFGKSPFLFLFDCVFASSLFSSAPTTPQHTLTLTHHPPCNMGPSLMDTRSMNNSSQEQATSSLAVMKGLSQNQHCPRDTQMDC